MQCWTETLTDLLRHILNGCSSDVRTEKFPAMISTDFFAKATCELRIGNPKITFPKQIKYIEKGVEA